ncbi:hypothetical protein [Neomegalonema sp.]|uniref:hypothetical protein n=1 Tax=Neomegalonema sp. TaxID=2039713 RepID=UPI0026143D7D|nr:hypothetical protein [Neomegalonema sp.]MDD2870110.1 hypothetical protein [Neomegalonema sp.]
MVTLTEEQTQALEAFFESFDLRTTGAWALVEEGMREDWGVEDPEAAIEGVRRALRGESPNPV